MDDTSFHPFLVPTAAETKALEAARTDLASDPSIIEVRLGFRFRKGWITNERAIVVKVREKLSRNTLNKLGIRATPSDFLGVGVDVRTASIRDQLERLGIDLSFLDGRAGPGDYREPPNVTLDLVKEKMDAVFHVSPDSGFPNLRAFFTRIEGELTATMFEWEENHVGEALADRLEEHKTARLKMVTQWKWMGKEATSGGIEQVRSKIGQRFEHVWASTGSGKLIPSAYHIKVASRDGEEFWLSSGNWKDSGQPNIDPAGEGETSSGPLTKYNREWHVTIKNAKLAKIFEKYIDWDFEEAQRVPVDLDFYSAWQDVFVPIAALAVTLPSKGISYHGPHVVTNEELEVQPLLTPDRNEDGKRMYMDFATNLISKAKQRIYIQNQSFNFLETNKAEFERFFEVLREKQKDRLDVKVIFRDPREFPGGGEKLDELLERLQAFGLKTANVRTQRKCHTKGIVVDGEEVLLGSHNLTNDGSLFNRDASLIVRNAGVASYFEKIFLHDWKNLSTQDATEFVGGIRLAGKGEPTPPGFKRVSIAELFDP